ncbi:hypothetical protein OROMI_016180 [Orobanche minor]
MTTSARFDGDSMIGGKKRKIDHTDDMIHPKDDPMEQDDHQEANQLTEEDQQLKKQHNNDNDIIPPPLGSSDVVSPHVDDDIRRTECDDESKEEEQKRNKMFKCLRRIDECSDFSLKHRMLFKFLSILHNKDEPSADFSNPSTLTDTQLLRHVLPDDVVRMSKNCDATRKYLTQIKESDGFDFTDFPGAFMGVVDIIPYKEILDRGYNPKLQLRLISGVQMAIDDYNKEEGTDYGNAELKNVNKCGTGHYTLYVTFSATNSAGANQTFRAKFVINNIKRGTPAKLLFCVPRSN